MDVLLGVLLGVAVTAAALAAVRLVLAPRRVLEPSDEAMRAALHAAAATLPHLRRGLDEDTAAKAVPHLRRIVRADALGIADTDDVLAVAGAGALPALVGTPDDRVTVEPPGVVAPVVVQGRRVGSLLAVFGADGRVPLEDVRTMQEAAALVAAQVELSVVAEQEERLAEAELVALRAQISPHFIYNALAAVANAIRTDPDEARELLTEFADFTRYAFRRQRPYVTLADELHYVETYLRLERARFRDRLEVRVEVAPEVLGAVVPALSLQPLVENAVRHGVEPRAGTGRVEVVGRDLGDLDVELVVSDDGPGMRPEQVAVALDGSSGGIGLSNVHQRLQATFGPQYGLRVASREGAGTAVTMTLPKFRAGVRAA